MSLITELKRRNVLRMAGLYLVGAWLITQVAGTVLPMFGAPDWLPRSIVILLLIGFVPTLVFSWIYELTPEGIRRDADVTPEQSIAPQTARRMDHMIIVVLICALVYFGIDKFVLAPQREAQRNASPPASAAREKAGSPDAAQRNPGPVAPTAAAAALPEKSIAVLPFENLSDDKANAYFAEGMQDEILTRLAGIADLKVISRTSTRRYESRPDNLKTVAAELGAAHILEGSVQKAGESVRVNVQLIDARTDTHLWAQTFDRELKNVFVVETEVAQQIADVLKARMSPQEAQALTRAPTENSAAYDHFLRAEFQLHRAWSSFEDADYAAADGEFEQAIALDPNFALAYARRAFNQLGRHWSYGRLGAQRLLEVRSWIDRALALAPDLASAYSALGYFHYWGSRDYEPALAAFARAVQLAPNSVDALSGTGFIQRRLGHWSQALESLQRAIAISPRDSLLLDEYGSTLMMMRRNSAADPQMTKALELDPGDSNAKDFLLRSRLFGSGDAAGARATIESAPAWRIPYHNLLAGDLFNLVNARVYPDLFERHFDAALRQWESAPHDNDEERLTQRVARVAIKLVAGERASLQAECSSLRPVLLAQVKRQPDALSTLQQTSWVELCLGHNSEAIAAARHATQVLPLSKDAFFGVYQLEGLAEIDARAGAQDEALKLLDQLLSVPAGQSVTVERLRRDPLWDPLRKDPRLDVLIARYTSGKEDAR
jgi:TolB-like protein/Tfp pilus assembly protein PilF